VTTIRLRRLFLAAIALGLTAGLIRLPAEEGRSVTSTAPVSREGKTEAGSVVKLINQEMDHPVLQRRNPRYVLRPGDIVEIDFPFAPAFNQVQTVQPDGYISLQNLGDLYVGGKTVPELTQAVKEKYIEIMKDPVITVVLKDFEHPYFIASGEVAKPGKYELRGTTTVAQAIAIAGGFSDVAKSSHVLLFRRVSDDYVNIKELNLKKMLGHGELNEDVDLQPGDLLFVPKSITASVLKTLFPHTTTGFYFPVRVP
jgi:protein involved in polysaccharide export with SLBB domain